MELRNIMQILEANSMKLIANNTELGKKFPKEVIPYLVKAAESVDNKLRSEIENQIVKMGKTAIPVLVEELETAKGIARGMVTMALIRLGSKSIEPLRNHFEGREEFNWVTDYIVNEIQGTKIPLGKFQEVMVG